MFFTLPSSILPHTSNDTLLAYCELFQLTKSTPYAQTGLYRVKRAYKSPNRRAAVVVPVDQIIRSCHLLPHYRDEIPWRSSNVLEQCESFYVNKYLDVHTFVSMS